MPNMNHRYTIETLKELIAVRRDAEEGFRTCAEHARSERLKQICMVLARECTDAICELKVLVRQLGGDPDARGTLYLTACRGWTDLREALACGDDRAILDVCEHGESRLLEAYRNALDDHLPDFVRALVLRQFEGVMSNHDQISDIRAQQPVRADVAVVVSTGSSSAQARQHTG
jgi:uncharacterized protein (TIGR02284 family)